MRFLDSLQPRHRAPRARVEQFVKNTGIKNHKQDGQKNTLEPIAASDGYYQVSVEATIGTKTSKKYLSIPHHQSPTRSVL
jgi:hypothetical protein